MTEHYFEIDKAGNVTVSAYLQAIFPDLTVALGDDMRSVIVDYGEIKCTAGQTAFVRSTSDDVIRYKNTALPDGTIPEIEFDISTRVLTLSTLSYDKAYVQGIIDTFMLECAEIVPYVYKLVFRHREHYTARADLSLAMWLDGNNDLLLPNIKQLHYSSDVLWANGVGAYTVWVRTEERLGNSFFYPDVEGCVIFGSSSSLTPTPEAFWKIGDEMRGYAHSFENFDNPLINTEPFEAYRYDDIEYNLVTKEIHSDAGLSSIDQGFNYFTADGTLYGYDVGVVPVTHLYMRDNIETPMHTAYLSTSKITHFFTNVNYLNLFVAFPVLENYEWYGDWMGYNYGDFETWHLGDGVYLSKATWDFASGEYDVVTADMYLNSSISLGAEADGRLRTLNALFLSGSLTSESYFFQYMNYLMCDKNVMEYVDNVQITYEPSDEIVFYWNRDKQSLGADNPNSLNFMFGTSAVAGNACWLGVDSITIFEGSDYSGLNLNGDILELWTVPLSMTIPSAVYSAYPNLLIINGNPLNPNWFAIGIEAGTIVWDDVEIWNQAWRWHDSYKQIVTRNTPTVDDGVNLLEMPKTIDELTVTIDQSVSDPSAYANLHSVAYRVANLDTQLSVEYLKVVLGMNIETACCSHGVVVYFWWNDTVDDYKDYVRGIVSNFAREDPPVDLTNVKKLLMVSLNWENVTWEKDEAFDAHGTALNDIYPLRITYRISTGDGLTGRQPLTIQPIYKYQDGTDAPAPKLGISTAYGVTGDDYHV